MATCIDKILCENAFGCDITILDIDGNPVNPLDLNNGDSVIFVLGDKPGYIFNGWVDDEGNTVYYEPIGENRYIIRGIDCQKQYIARYCTVRYRVEVTCIGECLQPYVEFTTYGSIVNVHASDNLGCRFMYWAKDGVIYSEEHSFDYVVTDNATFVAHYDDIQYRITAKPNFRNRGTCTGSGLYDLNDEVTISATPNQGYAFDGWDDGSVQQTRTVTVRGNKTYTALFSVSEEPDYSHVLKFTGVEGGGSVAFIVNNWGYELPETYKKPSLQYSTDGGNTWQDYDLQINTFDPIELAEGASVMFKGVNNSLAYYLEDNDACVCMQAYVGGNVTASGDVTSLLNGVGGDVAVPQYCYYYMFDGCTGLTQAPALPATTLADNCYTYMFSGCTGLTQAPTLPATTLADNCYTYMFDGCTGLTQAPTLPATTLANSCYNSMFSGCTGLVQAPELPALTLAEFCYSNMFIGCTGLTTAPELPATTLAYNCYTYMFDSCTGLTQAPALPITTLANSCYYGMFIRCTGLVQAPELPALTLAELCYSNMFYGCTGLTAAPALPATTLANSCYSGMFNGCTGITSHHVATLNNSIFVFVANTSCTSFTIHDETPPVIGSTTITGLKSDCIIYVPAQSVTDYQTAQYWSARANYIQPIP